MKFFESKLRWRAPLQAGCPTIIDGNKKVLKRKQIRPLNQKKEEFFYYWR